jgi:tRNA dimethylallyltransferase
VAYNCIVLLGPTAVGKTALGVQLAAAYQGEILSADSRQVYRGLDIGSGKDLAEYTLSDGSHVPYHLIDIADLTQEYNVFDYQQDFYRVFQNVTDRGVLPVIVGGTGMYLDAVLRAYDMMPVPEDASFRIWCEQYSTTELSDMLVSEKKDIHNISDLKSRERVIRALEIDRYMKSDSCAEYRRHAVPRPLIQPFVLGTTLDRTTLRSRIAVRLKDRLEHGMIDEVRRLHEQGASWDRLERLGLEYRFVSEYLQHKIDSPDQLFSLLNIAIGQFAKRQETWFRGMEKKGVTIHWLPPSSSGSDRILAAQELIQRNLNVTH